MSKDIMFFFASYAPFHGFLLRPFSEWEIKDRNNERIMLASRTFRAGNTINFVVSLFSSPDIRLMKPDKAAQTEALWRAISDILWKIGDKKKVIVTLPQETTYVSHSIAYFQDSITEKVSEVTRCDI